MDSNLGKLFIGGILWETMEEKLMGYFGQHGAVLHVVVTQDKIINRSHGFRFVAFAGPFVMATIGSKNLNAKLVLLDDMGAGKSSLVLHFVKGHFVYDFTGSESDMDGSYG